MAVVTFVSHDGSKHEAPLVEGQSLMQIATNNAIPGIDGDCGGEAACGTCHVVVDPQWTDQVGLSGPVEEEMLAMHPERQPTSRLSCQMKATEEWDGLIVETPEYQM
ncbi:MAG: 2Fe-2S iron-sulfur cluster-binding protein [Corynebacteriales bacterium]|nr:2Fe-2S iron-sulfur cluster-binding protein [Mycobacteriales bacterium]